VLTSPISQAQATERLAIIRPLLDYTAGCSIDGVAITSREMLVRFLMEKHNVSRRTLHLWLQRFKEGGFAALADKRPDRTARRWAAQSERHTELADLAAYAFLHEHLSKRLAWEIVSKRAENLGIEPPSYETIRTMLEGLPAAVTTLALKGREKYDVIFAPYVSRGYEDMEAGEWLVTDHADLDELCRNDVFGKKDQHHMRLRFTGLEDMRSRRITACAFSEEGSSRSINSCLNQHISKHGIPRGIYADRGNDMILVGKGAVGSIWKVKDMPPEALGVLARLGVEIKHCLPYHGQSKIIERFNNILHQRFDRRWLTYCGPTPDERPERCEAALERHQKLLTAGRVDESPLPLASEVIRACALWIESEYNCMEKLGAKGMKGMTPNQAWDEFRWQKQPPPPEPQVLACLLAERETRTVHDNGIKLADRRYIGADEYSRKAMHDLTGEQVMIAFDPCNLDAIAVIDQDGTVIAQLEPENLLRHDDSPETRAAIAESMAERQHRYHETREQLDALSRRVRSTGYIPQNDAMLALGRLPLDIAGMVVHRPQLGKPSITLDAPSRPTTPAEAARIALQSLSERARQA
jgi:putative transposase